MITMLIYAGLLFVAAAMGCVAATDFVMILFLMTAGLLLEWLFLRYRRALVFLSILMIASLNAYMCIDLVCNGVIQWLNYDTPMIHVIGYAWVLAIFLLAYVLSGRVRAALVIGNSILALFAIVSYMLIQLRGRTLLASDLFSIRVAMNVAGHYTFPWSGKFVLGLCMWVVGTLMCWFLSLASPWGKNRPKLRYRLVARGVCLCLGALFIFCFYGTYMLANAGLFMTWNENDFSSSPLTYFMYSINEMQQAVPTDYNNTERLDEIMGDTKARPAAEDSVQPHVIAIMSESFADLDVIRPFDKTADSLSYFRTLWENSIHGYAYSSVYGANTANSEYEFLTGNSLVFEGASTVPYQMDINYKKDTLVSILKDQGYSAKMLHPYNSNGWNRIQVYDLFGFEETNFLETWVNPKRLRGYVSDQNDYEHLIQMWENRKDGEKMFLFNITMQNHGNYRYQNFPATVQITGHEGEFALAEQYLTILKATDAATKYLIDYFSQVDEPVILVFFGDHQPRLEAEFYDFLYGNDSSQRSAEDIQRMYTVPFLIWKNYEEDSRDLGHISLNYLGQLTLQEAGLGTSAFGNWLMQLREEYPSINAYGYTDKDGVWHEMPTDLRMLPEKLQQYWALQYNFLHDTNGYRDDLFAFDPNH